MKHTSGARSMAFKGIQWLTSGQVAQHGGHSGHGGAARSHSQRTRAVANGERAKKKKVRVSARFQCLLQAHKLVMLHWRGAPTFEGVASGGKRPLLHTKDTINKKREKGDKEKEKKGLSRKRSAGYLYVSLGPSELASSTLIGHADRCIGPFFALLQRFSPRGSSMYHKWTSPCPRMTCFTLGRLAKKETEKKKALLPLPTPASLTRAPRLAPFDKIKKEDAIFFFFEKISMTSRQQQKSTLGIAQH